MLNESLRKRSGNFGALATASANLSTLHSPIHRLARYLRSSLVAGVQSGAFTMKAGTAFQYHRISTRMHITAEQIVRAAGAVATRFSAHRRSGVLGLRTWSSGRYCAPWLSPRPRTVAGPPHAPPSRLPLVRVFPHIVENGTHWGPGTARTRRRPGSPRWAVRTRPRTARGCSASTATRAAT